MTREHLDFHWTMEHYCKTKFKLFREYAGKESLGVLPHNFALEKLVEPLIKTKELVCFGKEERADIHVSQMKEHPELEFELAYR